MREQLADFLAQNLKEIALERVFKKQDTSMLPDAAEVIKRTFAALKARYEPKQKREVETTSV